MKNKWVRRAISIPLLIFGGAVLVGVFPVLACVLPAVDLFRDRRFPLIRAYAVLVFYCIWEAFGITAAFLAWLVSGVWMGRNRARFLRWNYALQRLWVQGFASVGLRLFSMRLRLEEDLYPSGENPILLLVRHTSLADTILATYLMRIQKNFRLRYVMKRELLWDPCLDIVGNRLPNYFVDRGSADTRHEAEAIAALAENLGPEEGVILWPEGTRFSPAKRDRALARIKEAGDVHLLELASRFCQVLPPRMRGIAALLERNPGMDVFFCSHTGFEKAASFKDIFGGTMIGREIRARLWGFDAESVPKNPQELKQWVYEKWRLVDDFVVGAAKGMTSEG